MPTKILFIVAGYESLSGNCVYSPLQYHRLICILYKYFTNPAQLMIINFMFSWNFNSVDLPRNLSTNTIIR